ncbi:MAG: hypothetical protein RL235_442, partial [Chlamydiota bacterium]
MMPDIMRWIVLLFFFLTSCGPAGRGSQMKAWVAKTDAIQILTTTRQIGDVVAKVGGDRVAVWVLIDGELDPHSYELVKGDVELLELADHVFYNGLG